MEIKTFNNSNIRRRITDNYFSATDMCKMYKKEFSDYNRLKQTKEYLQSLEEELNMTIAQLVDIKKGNSSQFEQGTYVHPYVATHLAMWISPKFAVKVTKWIEEWKLTNDNKQIYDYEISNLVPSYNDQEEAKIRDKLAIEYNAQKEVKCKYGIADLVTNEYVIEIKKYDKWHHAIGQVLAYSMCFDKKPAIYLFGGGDRELIKPCLSKLNIILLDTSATDDA